jgi:predicted metalloprotease with PDZ domain
MPVRVDAVRAERDGHISIVGYYRLSRVEFERVLAYYRAAERALGMTVVTVFPLLAADMPGQSDLLVTAVEQSSPADRAGVVAGDLIVSVDGRDVSSLEEYALAADQGWETTRSRSSLDLRLFSSGAQVIKSLKKR